MVGHSSLVTIPSPYYGKASIRNSHIRIRHSYYYHNLVPYLFVSYGQLACQLWSDDNERHKIKGGVSSGRLSCWIAITLLVYRKQLRLRF